MGPRVTKRDVYTGAARIAQRHEPNTTAVGEADRTFGEPWRLFVVEVGGPAVHYPGLDNGFLGWTAREAVQTLRGIEAGMDAQKLIQADTIRGAAAVVRGESYDELAATLDELAPPTEF